MKKEKVKDFLMFIVTYKSCQVSAISYKKARIQNNF